MAATYSSFFCSGLLAHHAPSAQMPGSSSPATPRAAAPPLVLDDATPTAHSTTATTSRPLPSITLVTPDDSRPRLRRRRSSLAGASSPLATVKASTPIRNAASSVQRNLRVRSGSDASLISTVPANPPYDDPSSPKAPKPTTLIGRLRSGSVGTSLRSNHKLALRRARPPVPALPPPTMPLPDVPPTSAPTTPIVPSRPPLGRRAETFDNYGLTSSPFGVAGTSPMCLDDEDRDVFAAAACQPPSPARLAFLRGAENTMQLDYPSPVDVPAAMDWCGSQQRN